MKKLLISVLLHWCFQNTALAQFCGSNGYGLRIGAPGAPTGFSFTRVMDTRNSFEWMVGYNGLFNRVEKTTVTMVNEQGQPETQTFLPAGYRNALLVGGTFQVGLLAGNPRGNGQSLYLNLGLRGRVHLDRPVMNFDSRQGFWITPELAVGPGFQVGLGPNMELYADAQAVYYNPEDAVATTGEATNYTLGVELGGGLRYRIYGCRYKRRR
ncbi:MAG: hypothetical protein KF690_03000 [Bacteroidetes bacterium]|nr:hypothetical protein [Bacteroidota bacterium]